MAKANDKYNVANHGIKIKSGLTYYSYNQNSYVLVYIVLSNTSLILAIKLKIQIE